MKKITLIVSKRHLDKFLNTLRGLGLLHIKHVNEPRAEHLDSIEHKISTLDKALAILESSTIQRNNLDDKKLALSIKEVVDLDKLRRGLSQSIGELEKKTAWFKQWGNVSSGQIAELEEEGVFIKLYSCDQAALKHIPKDKTIHIVSRQSRTVLLALVSTSADAGLDFSQAEVPGEDQHSLTRKIAAASRQLKDIDFKLNKFAAYRHEFVKYKARLLKDLEFHKVQFGAGVKEELSYLRGFCPDASIEKIAKASKKEGWAIIVEDPDEPEEVPTLIRNPSWVEIIRPVFNFMGTLPGYQEHDISFWFLAFFSLFFAMLIGDAGYGFLFLGVTFFARRKLPKVPREPFFLMYVLAVATIIWGAVTGNWFGAEKIGQLPGFKVLVVDKINSFAGDNQNFMIYICFLIGAVHLTLAHTMVAFKYINSWVALSQVGWIAIIWTSFFIAGQLVLSKAMPGFALILGFLGVLLVVLFSNFQKNVLKGALISLADLPLKAISSFADVVSYLRLFAVGYASVVLAVTFNKMAFDLGFNNIFTAALAAFILFLGHSLNIVLGFMGVIVHGIRLNMLEFSGHLNMEWSGRQYKPFKE